MDGNENLVKIILHLVELDTPFYLSPEMNISPSQVTKYQCSIIRPTFGTCETVSSTNYLITRIIADLSHPMSTGSKVHVGLL